MNPVPTFMFALLLTPLAATRAADRPKTSILVSDIGVKEQATPLKGNVR